MAAEASAAAGVLEGTRKEQALDMAREAGSGEVPDDLLTALDRILTASLQGGRARHLYKAEGERLLTRVLSRTPGWEATPGESGRRQPGAAIPRRPEPGAGQGRHAHAGTLHRLACKPKGSGWCSLSGPTACGREPDRLTGRPWNGPAAAREHRAATLL